MLQIIKFGISKYLYLCVEAGFSQIQLHIYRCHLSQKTDLSDNTINGAHNYDMT